MQFDRSTLRKLAFVLGVLIVILAQTSQSATTTLTPDPYGDPDFTKKNQLIFADGKFKIGETIITPYLSSSNKEYDLFRVQHAVEIKDYKTHYKFTLNFTNTLGVVEYVKFDMPNCKAVSDTIMHCGEYEIDFSDLIKTKFTIKLYDGYVYVEGRQLSQDRVQLDPLITLIPNATNKAYYSGELTTLNFNLATTEFSSAEYAQANSSDNTRHSLTVASTRTAIRYRTSRYTFNLTAAGLSINNINELKFCWEGFHADSNGYGSSDVYWYNVSSASWRHFQLINYGPVDDFICITFTSANKTHAFNATSGLAQFGVSTQAVPLGGPATSSASTDFAYLNVSYEDVAVTKPSLDEGDPLFCSIPSLFPKSNINIFCMPKSNVTGQPLAGQTITCGAYSMSDWSAVQSASQMSERAHGVYNWTFLSTNQVEGTCYIINCSTAIGGTTNGFAASSCVMPSFTCASSSEVTSLNDTLKASWGYENRTQEIAEWVWTCVISDQECLDMAEIGLVRMIWHSPDRNVPISNPQDVAQYVWMDEYSGERTLTSGAGGTCPTREEIWESPHRNLTFYNCTGDGGSNTYYVLNQTVVSNSEINGLQNWLSFQTILFVIAVCFLGFGVWKHDTLTITIGGLIFIILGFIIYSEGIASTVGEITQLQNYTYNEYAQLTNLTVNETISYNAWKDNFTNLIAFFLMFFGAFAVLYSVWAALQNRRKDEEEE